MNKSLVESDLINENFETKILPLKFVEEVDQIGKVTFGKFIRMIKIWFNLLWYLISFRPNLVYITLSPTGGAFYRDSLYVFLIKLFGKKILFHLHGKGIKEAINGRTIKKRFYKMVFNNTEVICLSNALVADIEQIYFKKPFIVNNGIEIIDQSVLPKEGNSEKVQIIFLSNLIKEKGILTFLDAVNELNKINIDFNAVIIGKSFDISVEFVESFIVKNGLSSKVSYIGPKYGNDKFKYLVKDSILVLPTYYKNEAFPLVLLEAMQFGIPVISTFEGGIPDIIDDGINGFLTQKLNPEELVEKLKILIENQKLRRSMGDEARKKFLSNYTKSSFEIKMNDVFDRVIKNEPSCAE